MPGHGRDDYTLERMLERRHRNNIRKYLERNGRRMTAREIDIVNLCTRYPDQRYTLFTYYCDGDCMRVNPYALPQLPVPDHHNHHCPQRQTVGTSDSDRSGPASLVAPLLFQLNIGPDDANARTEGQSETGHPSTSRVILPCYFLTDRPEASASSGMELGSTVNLIADTIIESLNRSSDKENSERDSSDKGNDERERSDKVNSKKSSRKNSKKNKRHKKKGGAKSRVSETQTRTHYNPSNEPCVSSDSSSSSHAETFLVDGDGGEQRVKSDTETVLRCFSSNSSDRCHADVSCSNSMLSSDEEEANELALPETVGPSEDTANEDPSALEEMDKADEAQCSSDACISNDFILVVSSRKGRYGRRYGQQGGNPSRFSASGEQFSTCQEKPSKVESGDKYAMDIKDSKPRNMRTENFLTHESSNRAETPKPDSNISGSVDRHSGEYVYQKDEFPSLSLPSSGQKEVIRRKVGPRPPRSLKKPPVPLPIKSPECKESESDAVVDTKLSIPNLEVKICEVEESGSGSGSSSGDFFSPDSSKSSQMNQSSHDTSGLDSPRSSKASDETQFRPDTSTSDATGDKSTTVVAQAGHDTCPSNLSNTTPTLTDIDASRFGSSVCSSPASSTPISPSTSMPCLDIGESKNMLAVCSTNLEEILGAVRDAHKVYQASELVQSAFGGPFADYELLCHYASPILDIPPHQIADAPLQKIWQWYEEPSCYTLEVKGCQDHHRFLDFTAHFVPSLSAVQLFVRGPSAICSKHQPKEGGSESAELVFEFFEYEQPYFRQTLFEKVKELVGGMAQGRNLERLRLGDLHPASWFSVAWYPAYTVPEGRSSFKAAFLTYHSLAHFVQGAAGPSVDGSSFPVVGLMSYNAQEESWYHERYQTGGELMVERLESLNLTAGVMARAWVMRGGQVSGNHHPDFEFFASRQYRN
ncbi:uncharacterized protein LOC144556875 isoform X1 [Carex rostrata]